jgi:hypothetical protein
MAFSTLLTPDNAFAVTKSDTTTVDANGFYVGVTGDVTVMPFWQEGQATPTAVTFKAVPVGVIINLKISRFMSTGTTATNIIAFQGR